MYKSLEKFSWISTLSVLFEAVTVKVGKYLAAVFLALPLENFALFSLKRIAARICPMKDDFLTVRDVAEMLKLAEKTVYSLVAQEEIPGFKVGGSWRFRKTEIDRWIREKEKRA